MNEQELADLFSAQIDRILGGESAVAVATNGDLSLLSLGQQLAQLNFQASPAAQVAFQSQLVSWFGKTGGSSLTTDFGFSKILLMSVGAIAMIGAGLGLVVLISSTWTGALFDPSTDDQPVPAVTQPAPPSSPKVTHPALAPQPPAPATPTPTRPPATSSLRDVLPPAVTASVGDTLPRPPSSSTPAETVLPTTATPGSNFSGDDNSGSNDTGDHDRGHGNDPDQYDEDNPGQSQGPSGDAGQSNDPGGTLPDNQSGGNGGGSGGSGSGNGGGNGGTKNNQGGGQDNKKRD